MPKIFIQRKTKSKYEYMIKLGILNLDKKLIRKLKITINQTYNLWINVEKLNN